MFSRIAVPVPAGTPPTIVGWAARFREEDQADMLELFDERGVRYAKRYTECTMSPPTRESIGDRILNFVEREFPTEVVSAFDIATALASLAEVFESVSDSDDDDDG
jgi:hypothetical protein